MAEKIKVFIKRPDSGWYSTNISNTLENFQRTVEGFIEIVPFTSDAVIVCNEEGRLRDLPFNCNLIGVDFVGTIFVVGVDDEENQGFCDVPITFKEWKELLQADADARTRLG